MAAMKLLVAVFLAACVSQAFSLIIPASGQLPEASLIKAACEGVPKGVSVCNPYAFNKYIVCGENKVKTCKSGTLYDYALRVCIGKGAARPCNRWNCPAPGLISGSGMNGSGPFLNQWRTMDPVVINVSATASTKTYLCPVQGHCQTGMIFKLTSLGKAPSNRPAQKFHLHYVAETNSMNVNEVVYPVHMQPDVVGYEGDVVTITWDAPLHVIAEFNPKAKDAAPITPYPPQPMYSCPAWVQLNQTATGNLIMSTVPGEIRLMEVSGFMGGRYNLTVNETISGYYASTPLPPYCRLGMIFKITVNKASGTPKTYPIDWTLKDYQNKPDLVLNSGDVLAFSFPPPQMTAMGPNFMTIQPHGITLLPPSQVTPFITYKA